MKNKEIFKLDHLGYKVENIKTGKIMKIHKFTSGKKDSSASLSEVDSKKIILEIKSDDKEAEWKIIPKYTTKITNNTSKTIRVDFKKEVNIPFVVTQPCLDEKPKTEEITGFTQLGSKISCDIPSDSWDEISISEVEE